MANTLSTKDTLRLAVLIGFLAAATVGGCTGMGEMREREHGGGEGSEEESRTTLALDATYDEVRNGARLVLRYDAEANAFVGTVQNVTEGTLSRVRVEVHLSNGTELGPTTPGDLAPGDKIDVTLQATDETFTGWTAHPEVGGGAESEHGPDGESNGGEQGEQGERRGEHD